MYLAGSAIGLDQVVSVVRHVAHRDAPGARIVDVVALGRADVATGAVLPGVSPEIAEKSIEL